MKYIDADKLYEYLEQVSGLYPRYADNIVDNAVGNVIGGIKTFITSLQQGQPSLSSNLDEAAEEYLLEGAIPSFNEGFPGERVVAAFKAGAEWQREQYECIPAEEAYMRGFAQGAKEERKDLTPLINRLCEAILFEWKDAADLARKTLTQIKAREE